MTLVLLPGMDGSGALFEHFVAALGADFKVEIVRYPSVEPLGYSELEAIARNSVPEDGPIVILGESFSGPIAVSLASTLSSQLKGLILCCSFVRNPHPSTLYLKPLIPLLPIYPKLPKVFSDFLFGRFSSDDLRSALSNAIEGVSPSAIRARLTAVIEVDVSAKLALLRVPVLYLRASEDRLVPRSASETIAYVKPDVRITQLEAPHFLLQAAPEEAAQHVSAFVHEVGGVQYAL